VEFGRETTVNTQELFIHDGSKRKVAEGVHARVVDGLRVLVLALELEREVVGQVTTLVVTTEKEEGVGVPHLERPEVENTLKSKLAVDDMQLTSMEK
jgi:hypothetical protein